MTEACMNHILILFSHTLNFSGTCRPATNLPPLSIYIDRHQKKKRKRKEMKPAHPPPYLSFVTNANSSNKILQRIVTKTIRTACVTLRSVS